MEELLKRDPHVIVLDQLHGQLTELVKALNPSVKYTPADLDRAATGHLGGTPSELYGVWVHYPWSNRLVHLLDEQEFAFVRTDRNRNKITAVEQATLATKKIGVIGLSVGQSVSLTLAQERGFGELRLADFDILELSNLNRIRSGVHQLGQEKVVNTAREIAELDPFLKVVCYPEGITTENIDAFLTEGGDLDLLIEECDSVAVKVIARQRAKALRIPVVMDTSDRGLIDVERFDLEPDRPILHGLVDHLDLALAAKARTNEEKLPFVVPIIGLDTMSTRMKASMLEIESTVTTWPQLASSVVLGGAAVTHTSRRILLGEDRPSGRWWLDLDDLMGVGEQPLNGSHTAMETTDELCPPSPLTMDEMIAIAEKVPGSSVLRKMTAEEAEQLASAGSTAPSGGNCQPWKFLHHHGRLFLFMDGERAHGALDPGLRYAMLGMGACLENMMLEAVRLDFQLEHAFAPLPDEPHLVAVLSRSGSKDSDNRNAEDLGLAEFINVRCTNRKNSETEVMEDAEEKALITAVSERYPLCPITVVRDRARLEKIALLCGEAERIRFLNTTCHRDMFIREMRWTNKEVNRTRDGIDLATLELSITDRTGLRVAADPGAMSLIRHWGAGNAMEKMGAKSIRASSAVVIISIPDFSIPSAYAGGRAMQRLWLKAAALGIIAHPVGAPIFMGIHGLWDTKGILSKEEHHEAQSILTEFKKVIGSTGSEPFFMMRLGRAGEPTARSLRLPLSTVFTSTTAITA